MEIIKNQLDFSGRAGRIFLSLASPQFDGFVFHRFLFFTRSRERLPNFGFGWIGHTRVSHKIRLRPMKMRLVYRMDELRFYAEESVAETIAKAEKAFGVQFPKPKITFDVGGNTVAGRAHYYENRIALNPKLFQANQDDYIVNTIPHEVAHLITHRLYDSRNVKHHGPEWREVMRKLGVSPDRTHDYKSVVKRKRRRVERSYTYICNCDAPQHLHRLTAIKHNRIQNGSVYRCKRCKSTIHEI